MRKEKTKRGKARRIVISALAVVVILSVGTGVYAYESLRPSQHFQSQRIPVLAIPTSSQNGTKTISTTAQTEAAAHSTLGDGVFNILVLGVDSRAPTDAGRTDTIMVAHVNLNTNDFEVISIPRDTRVNLPGYGLTKITHANYMGELKGGIRTGTRDAIQAVSNLTGLEINYYVETSFWGLKDIVDTLGGINVYVPFPVQLDNGPFLKEGNHFLLGAEALALARERYSLPNGDFGRQRLQLQILIGIAQKMRQPSVIVHLPTLVKEVSQYLMTTNMSTADLLSLGLATKNFHSNEVHYFQVPGHSGYFMDPIVGAKLYYWIADMPELHTIITKHFLH